MVLGDEELNIESSLLRKNKFLLRMVTRTFIKEIKE